MKEPTNQRGFGSDNHSGVHPKILQALAQQNHGHAPAYQTDEVSRRVEFEFKQRFGPQSSLYFVFNGTAANVLALSAITKSYQTVIVSSVAHLENDECGAPEKLLGIKLKSIPTPDGKLTPELVRPHLIRGGDQHFSQIAALSITQPTEVGTTYSTTELSALVEFARKHHLFLHMDGARLSNAVFYLDSDFATICKDFDVVSFGGTKNGLVGCEAVVVMNASLGKDLKFYRKQFLQLPSKTRFLAAQFEAFFANELWREIAQHSCSMAQKLRQGLSANTKWEFTQPTQSNGVFVKIPRPIVSKLREKYFFYVWDESSFECRLMTSWDTTDDDIENFCKLAHELSRGSVGG